MVSALALAVNLASVFQGVSKGAVYSLRTIVCYFGHHYQVCCRLTVPLRNSIDGVHAFQHGICPMTQGMELSVESRFKQW